MKNIIYYIPRVLSILVVGFLSLFIAEGFGPDFGWQDSVMHLILALIFLGFTIVAWKWPRIGGWIFVLLGLAYLAMIFRAQWWGGIFIGSVPLVIGILFLIEGWKK
jgi:hypothetical protein